MSKEEVMDQLLKLWNFPTLTPKTAKFKPGFSMDFGEFVVTSEDILKYKMIKERKPKLKKLNEINEANRK